MEAHAMSDGRELVAELISSLKQQRDEIALKIHLGKSELKEEWERLETKLQELNDRYEPAREAAGEAAGKVFDSLKATAHEIGEGFQKIRKAL
jgi:uncharacterized coiled-coil DUF342 family protein